MLISQQKLNTPKIKDFLLPSHTYIQDFIPSKNKHIYWTSSGRSALRYILEHIKQKHNFKDYKLKIGLPSFTCHVVLDSILRAKCKPVFIDSKEIISYPNLRKNLSKINALILPYNFGFLPELDKIKKFCKKDKIILIEDCAQALGSRYKDKFAGSFSNYSFFSFGISKNIGFLGGLILSKEKLAYLPRHNYPINKIIITIIKSITSNIFFNPQIYEYMNFLLKNELKKQQKPLDYKLPKFCQNRVTNMFNNYENVLKIRNKNAEICKKELKGMINFIEPIKNTKPSWLYFVLLSKNRNKLIKKLRKEKVEVTPLLTYKDLSKKGKFAKQFEKQHCCFALYRPKWEIDYIIKKIRKVCNNEIY